MGHMSRHVSRVTCHMFFGQSGEAYWWRVCYQRGLPRLVFLASAPAPTLDPATGSSSVSGSGSVSVFFASTPDHARTCRVSANNPASDPIFSIHFNTMVVLG